MSLPLYDPNDEKDAAARLGIHTHRKAIRSLDAKIASLLDVVETLRDLKREHEDKLRRCQSVLTLAGRLPTDMLGHIFKNCAEASPSTPLVLSQVCMAWRVASHSTPSLWSRIYVNCSDPRSVEKANHWVSMSGDHVSLHVTLLLTHNATLLPGVMRVLLPHSSRWTKLTVDAELPFHASEVLDIIRVQGCALQRLHTVHFLVQGDLEGVLNFQDTLHVDVCSRLQTIHFSNTMWQFAAFPPHVTTLYLTVPTIGVRPQFVSQVIELLRELPKLEVFSLVFSDGSFFLDEGGLGPVGDLAITMDHLHTLILTGCDRIFEVLAHMIVPSLRRLVLRATGEENSQTRILGRHLNSMIELSSPCLRTIELYDVDASDEDFTRSFHHLPELEELFLHESEISDAVFHSFCSPSHAELQSSWVCPRLRRLDLRWCSQLSGKVLVELVKSRLTSPEVSRVLEVAVINCSFVREEDVFSLADITVCRLDNRPEDFCYHRGCCTNNRYRHRFMLRHAAELRQRRHGDGRLEL